ncbi:hypothetical protein EG68_06275 [Paragonimus skrjabini miyazakii]|uniref:Uncharacterized protein n=1 Tax=Paragonimus skrjabini miyazakii TaxID=59628 RepID=A0A8S9YUV0_9TREM|nr:hypothetical protein EG68_06275 [Paragonimus skrjabini miyazakii]
MQMIGIEMSSTAAANPWCSDRNDRYQYLVNTLMLCRRSTHSGLNNVVVEQPTQPVEENSTEILLMWMKTVFQEPNHNVGTCPTTRDSSSLKTCIETELTNHDEAKALSVLSFLLNELSHCLPDASNTRSLGLLCEITLSTLVSHIRKPLPSSVSSCMDELASNPHFQDLVFSSLLPSVLLVSGHRNSDFVLNMLRTATPHSRLVLLRVLCSSDNFWPNDSFPVLQFLITSIDDMTTTGDLVVRAFQKQLRSNNALYESVPFTNLLIHFVRAHSSHLSHNLWPILDVMAQRQNNFLRSALLQLLQSKRTSIAPTSTSPIL